MARSIRIGKKEYTKLPVRKTKTEAKISADYWRKRGHSARLVKASDGKYYVAVQSK